MIVYANVFSDKDEEYFGLSTVSGAHFYQDSDPVRLGNKVLKVSTWNTVTNLPSKTNISATTLGKGGATCEFEMRYRFDVIPWLYWPRFFTLQFQNREGNGVFVLSFDAIDHSGPGGSATKMAMRHRDGRMIDGTVMNADCWYGIRIEYYQRRETNGDSRAKIYIAKDGEEARLVADFAIDGSSDAITKACIQHSATKIKGTQYFDDISFTTTDRKYSPLYEEATPRELKKIYDFEDGIPSNRSFNIEMQLKKGDERGVFDPASWKSALLDSPFRVQRSFCEISLVLDGTGSFIAEGKEYPMTQGSIFITAPGCGHSIIADSGYKILSVMGHFEKLAFIEDSCALNDNIYNEGKKLAELVLYNRFGNEDYLEALCDAYVKYIIMNLDRPPKSTTAAIYKLISVMEKNFDKSDLSIGKILDDSGYARDYIRSEFLSLTGLTPKKYLNNIRMKNAKAMIDLYGGDMSLGEIAERCGIIDQSIFSRIFKKHFGFSPTEYKQSMK